MVEIRSAKPASSRVHIRIGTAILLVWLSVSLFAGGSVFALDAETENGRRGLILVMNRPLDSEAEQLFEGVVAHSVRWSLERQKLGVIETPAPSFDATAFGNPTDMLDSSVTSEVDFILFTEYASRGQDLEIRMSWYDPHSGEKTEEVLRRGRKDLVLDKIIREAMDELLSAVEASLSSLEPREFIPVKNPGSVAPAASATPVAPVEQTGNGLPAAPVAQGAPPQTGAPGSGAGLPSPPISAAEAKPAQAEAVEERTRHFEIAVGCAPFVATGAASEYFKLGVMPALSLSYLFQGSRSRFALGLYGGLNCFSAAGSLSSAETFLIPMGVALRYEIGSERYPGVLFGLSSGPALLMMNSSLNGTLLGLTFFGRASLGVRIPIGRTFALLVEAGYDVYWEQPNPIMGFTPAVFTTIRL